MTQDEIEGRLIALEAIAFASIGGLLACMDYPGKPASDSIKFLDNIKAMVKLETSRINPGAGYEALEITDRILSAVSQQYALTRAKEY
jgi:hypothetical protein